MAAPFWHDGIPLDDEEEDVEELPPPELLELLAPGPGSVQENSRNDSMKTATKFSFSIFALLIPRVKLSDQIWCRL